MGAPLIVQFAFAPRRASPGRVESRVIAFQAYPSAPSPASRMRPAWPHR